MLETIKNMLTDAFGPLGPLLGLGGLGLLLIVLTLPTFLKKRADRFDRLSRDASSGNDAGKRSLRSSSGAAAKLDKFADFLEPKDEQEYSATKLKLLRAGYRGAGAVRAYHFLQFALGMGFLAIGVLVAIVKSATGEPTMQEIMFTALLPGIIGYLLPRYWVMRRVQMREEELENGFPDALDMMLVCVEAGQSLDQAIVRVSKEIQVGYPALSEEFETVANELKAGKDRVSVLKDMAERAGVTDISSFVTVMIQSATFGTPVADALRVYAAEMRDKRVMRAEEKANMLPTKLTLGTMMFTVPPLLIVLMGPSVYSMYQTLNQGQGIGL